MRKFSLHGWLLLMYCAGVTTYFVTACNNHWPQPFEFPNDLGAGFTSSGSSGGSFYSRSSGGSWGGGK
ncbi:MAG: hypothetical protein U0941_16465 [Planctomycetaceae bacterium]